MSNVVKIFTDGSCLGNPGSGGYATILHYKFYEKILTEGFYLTTNNRMELIAVISGLECLTRSCRVKIITDSLYVKKGIIDWIPIWKKKNWKNTKNKYVKNIDLWVRLDKALHRHSVTWFWVKAHFGHIENERCDKIAKSSAQNPLLKDIIYENQR